MFINQSVNGAQTLLNPNGMEFVSKGWNPLKEYKLKKALQGRHKL